MPKFSFRPAAVALLALAAAFTPMIAATAALAETAVAPEKNPPGDIPDTQAFVIYASASYALQVPEGWARSEAGPTVTFVSKLDGLSVTLSDLGSAPTLDWVQQAYLPDMIAKGRATQIAKVSTEKLPAGEVIKIAYSLNSEPNAVTTKQIRLEANRYLFFKAGKLAALALYAPLGADNVDQWQLMSQSFAWH